MFIVLEGIDGSGKSTLVRGLCEFLEGNSKSTHWHSRTICLCEPTKEGVYGKKIRSVLQDPHSFDQEANNDLLELFFLDRKWDIEENILPVLSDHNIIMDRYYYSTAAYQANNEIQCMKILRRYEDDKSILKADVVFYLDISPADSVARIKIRGEEIEAFESLERLTKISKLYEYILEQDKDSANIVRIDASGSSKNTLLQCINYLESLPPHQS